MVTSPPNNGSPPPRLLIDRVALLLALVFTPFACSSDTPETVPTEPGRLRLSEDGGSLGPFDAATTFDADVLRELLPGVMIVETEGSSEGEPYPILRLSRRETPWLAVHSADGQTLYAVEILEGAADLVEGLGARHGAALVDLYPPQGALPCLAGMEEESGLALCRSPETEHVQLVFSGEWNGPDGFLPPREVLETWTIQRILWRPSPP